MSLLHVPFKPRVGQSPLHPSIPALWAMSKVWLPLSPWPDSVHGPFCQADFVSCSSVVFDLVACVLAVPPHARVLRLEDLPVEVFENGTTAVEARAPIKKWAVDWADQRGWQTVVSTVISRVHSAPVWL
mmetsp:Transcript_63273/g.205370  ORF Transcript_63273/g.205370 Transcript_63273/m.205370 type:complete len:129 (-) Transcript_63273:492-878(-)